MKIGTKLMLVITAVNLVGIGGLTISSVVSSSNQLTAAAEENLKNIALDSGKQIRLYLEIGLDEIRAVAQVAGHLDMLPPADRRKEMSHMLESLAIENPAFVGVWAGFERNALDGLDAAFANTPGTDATGRFMSYYTNDHGKIGLEALGDIDNEAYYANSFKSGKEAIIEPYFENSVGSIITSLTVPIKRNGQIIGVAGVDLALKEVYDIAAKITPYGAGIAGVFSHDGIVVAHPDESRLGKDMRETEGDVVGDFLPTLVGAVTGGKDTLGTFFSPSYGTTFQIVINPLFVGGSVTPWATAVIVPIAVVMAPAHRMAIILVIFGVAVLVVITILVLLLSKSITAPLKSMEKVFDIIGGGDFTPTLAAKGNDEIGNISRSFNNTLGKIRQLIIIIKRQASSLSDIGNDLANNMTETAAAVNEITANIQSIKQRVINQSASVTETNATMEQVTVNINKLNDHVENQSNYVSQSSAAIEEMVANIASVTDTLVKNGENVKMLQDASEVGRTGLQDVAADIQEISRESEGLLEINSVMENIASQTNLLSMNAAIEAAHAGEAGKGFAVVADEIRKLAESSSEQSKTIGTVLKKIADSIKKITKSTENVLARFEAIDSNVKTVSQQEETIRNAMEEQGQGSKQILEGIGRVTDITRNVRSGSEEMLEGAQQVIQESQNLEKVTQEITSGMNEMATGANQINTAVHEVNEISGKNREGIDILVREVAKFKVE